ncbi:hypothetical protein BDV41DRAFT_375145 [Aspergillus transmontanensis]|uniref:BTB domain-containing protein n=1 Tax=Aspergillus transmontanensis TaxID=1034304 RepID=A0A5N6WC02_9EURO|nr:hypothetical protein BDV41DRAFT_375145 [Aspergillus transmontanensis]
MLASAQFKRTFQNGFQEGNELRSVGHVKVPICDWEPVPFLLLMAILHGRTQLVPQTLHFDWLKAMAILVDYYECYEAVAMVSDLWTKAFEREQSTLAEESPMEWLFITWAFRKGDAFESITKSIQLEHKKDISSEELPIPAEIIDTLRVSRQTGISNVIECLYSLLKRLRRAPKICSFECDLIRLGALIKGMHEFRILAENPQPGAGYSFMNLKSACIRMHRAYDSHHCKLMPEVLKVSNKVYDSLKCGLTLDSFTSLRQKP